MPFTSFLKSAPKLNLLNKFLCIHTSSRHQSTSSLIPSSLEKLNSSRRSAGFVHKSQYLKLIKHIEEARPSIQSDEAVQLLALCGNELIDLFPAERQQLLNYTFRELLPRQNVQYSRDHLSIYMNNTRLNNEGFDPYLILREMKEKGIQCVQSVDTPLVEQLCDNNLRPAALKYFIGSLENKAFELESLGAAESESEPALFKNLLSLLESKSHDYTDTLNPFLSTDFKEELLKFIKPNEKTYITLINNHIRLEEYDSAVRIIQEQKNNLTVQGLLSVYLKANESVEEAVNLALSEKLLESSGSESESKHVIEYRIAAINTIMLLCQSNQFAKAHHLIETHFAKDLDSSEHIAFKRLNTSDYFVKSLIRFKEFKTLVDWIKSVDGARGREYLKKLVSFSYLWPIGEDNKVSMQVFDEMERLEIPIKTRHFDPLIRRAIGKLVERFKEKDENAKKHFTNLAEFKAATDLIALIRTKYKCIIDEEDLADIIKILLRHCEEDPNFTKTECAKVAGALFKKDGVTNHNTLFNLFAGELLDDQQQLLKIWTVGIKSWTEKLAENFCGIKEMLGCLRVDYVQAAVLQRLTKSIRGLNSKIYLNLTHDLASNPILATLQLINEKTSADAAYKSDENLRRLNSTVYSEFLSFVSKYSGASEQKDLLIQFFAANRILVTENMEQLLRGEREHSGFEKSTFEIEEAKLGELVRKEKNTYPTVRRLIIAICKDFEVRRIPNHEGRIEELVGQLPESEFTAMLCHELMRYFTVRDEIGRAKHFYGRMMKVLLDFQISKEILLDYVQLLEKSSKPEKYDLNEVTSVFAANHWKTIDADAKENQSKKQKLVDKKLYNFLWDVYTKTKKRPEQFKTLSEAVLKSNFSQDKKIGEMVLLKLVTSNQYDSAFDFYKKFNDVIYKSGVFELLLMKHFIRQDSKKTAKEEDMAVFKELIGLMALKFEWEFTFNIIFWAHVINNNMGYATNVFTNDLKGSLDMELLERLHKAAKLNPPVLHSLKPMYNIFYFKPLLLREKKGLKQEIERILNPKNKE